jgi:outer membrane protein assembly complex protein YaeT
MKRKLLFVVIILGIVLGISLLVLHTGAAKREILRSLMAELDGALGVRITARSLDYNLFMRRFTLRGLEVRSPDAAGRPPFLQADEVRGTFPLTPLFSKPLLRKLDLEVVKPKIELLVGPGGKTNFSPAKSPGEKGMSPADILALFPGRVRLENAGVVYADSVRGIRCEVADLFLESNARGDALSFRWEEKGTGGLDYSGRHYAVESLTGEAEVSPEGVVLKKSTGVRVEGTALGVAGRIDNFRFPVVNLDVDGAVALDRLPVPAVIAGAFSEVAFRSHTEGSFRAPALRIALEVARSQFKEFRGATLAADVDWKDSGAVIRDLILKLAGGRATGSGAIHPFDWKSQAGRVALKWRSIDCAPFSRLFNLPRCFSSLSSGSLEGSWSAFSLASLNGRADIQLVPSGGAAAERDGIPLSGHVLARADSGTLSVDVEDFSAPGMRLAGTFRGNRDSVSGEFSLADEDLETLRPFLARCFRGGESDVLRLLSLRGGVAATGTVEGTPASPRIAAHVTAKAISVRTAKDLKLDGGLGYDSGALRLSPVTLQGKRGDLQISGTYPLFPPADAIDLSASGRQLLLSEILDAVRPGIPVEARVDCHATVSGTPASPTATSSWVLSDARVLDQELQKVEIASTFRDGVIGIESLRTAKGEGSLAADGTYDLGKEAYTAHLSVTDFPIGVPGPSRLLWPMDATLTCRGGGEGTLDAPRFALEGSLGRAIFGKTKAGDLPFRAESSGREITFHIEAPSLSAEAAGALGLRAPYPLAADVKARDFSIQILPYLNLSGVLSAEGDVRVDLARPRETLTSRIRIGRLRIGSGENGIQSQGPVTISYGPEGLQAGELLLKGKGVTVRLQGSLPRETPDSEGLSLKTELNLADASAFVPALRARGSLRLEARVQGSCARPELRAALDLDGVEATLPQPPLSVRDGRARIRVDRNVLQIESASLGLGGGTIEMRGSVPLEFLTGQFPTPSTEIPPRPAEITIDLANLGVPAVEPFLPSGYPRGLLGSVTGKVEIRGNPTKLSSFVILSSFETMEVKVLGVEFRAESSLFSFRDGRLWLDKLALTGPQDNVQVKGFIDFRGEPSLSLLLDGPVGLGVFRVLVKNAAYDGRAVVHASCTGDIREPGFQGTVEIQNGGFRFAEPRIGLSQVEGPVRLEPGRILFKDLRGSCNGGDFYADGELDYTFEAVEKALISTRVDAAEFNFPQGLRSEAQASLKLEYDGTRSLLSGTARITRASYREPLTTESEILRYMVRKEAAPLLSSERSPFLENMRFNVSIATGESLRVENNIVKSDIDANLRLTGTYYDPVLAGRVDIEEGGRLILGKNTYTIDYGSIDFVNPHRIEPILNIGADTRSGEYSVHLTLEGPPEKLSAKLSSEPPLSEPEIVSLLMTGKPARIATTPAQTVLGEQALVYVRSAFTGTVEKTISRALSIETMRIDPGLVATNEDPGARVTLGQHITRDLELIYSQSLRKAQSQTWILDYNPRRNVNFQGIKNDDNEYSVEARHEVRFGYGGEEKERAASGKKKKLSIAEILLEGRPGLTRSEILGKMKLRSGKHFDSLQFQEDLDRIQKLYLDHDYLGAVIRTERQEKDGKLILRLHVECGPRIILKVEGASVPGRVLGELKSLWAEAMSEKQALQDLEARLRLYLFEKRYYQADLHAEESKAVAGNEIVVFAVRKGPKYETPQIRFEGNRVLSEGSLVSFVRAHGLIVKIFLEPQKVVEALKLLYVEKGFLHVEAGPVRVDFKPGDAVVRVDIPIKEGPQFRVGKVLVSGNRFFETDALVQKTRLVGGESFTRKKYEAACDRVQAAYARKGFNKVELECRARPEKEDELVDVDMTIQENQRAVISDIRITGNSVTGEKTIRHALAFKTGDAVSSQAVNKTRKQLYDLGVFKRVDLDMEPLPSPGPDGTAAAPAAEGAPPEVIRYYRIDIRVTEQKPYRLRYGLFYDTETGVGVTGELLNLNLFGTGRLLGVSVRENRDEHEVRGTFQTGYFRGRRLNTNFSPYWNRKTQAGFTVDRVGLTLGQELTLSPSSLLTYNYSFERDRTSGTPPETPDLLNTAENVSRLSVAFTHDGRNSILNPTRGIFLSQSADFAPGLFGTASPFVRFFGQFSVFQRLPNRLTLASGLRMGLGKGIGGDLPPGERFVAGGATTIRGFGQDAVGPHDPTSGLPIGGDAIFILNEELRFPLYKFLSGAVFFDAGNVYRTAGDFNPFDTREAAGLGLRIGTPFLLLRLDWGFKLDRRAGENRSRLFFSVGNAF